MLFSLETADSNGKSLEMRLSGDPGFILFWVRPEIPQTELTSSRMSPQLTTSGNQEGKAEIRKTNGGEVQ